MKNRFKIRTVWIVLLISILGIAGCTREGAVESLCSKLAIENPEHGFISEYPASRWEESLISGNGTLGITMPGDALSDRIVFGHERLFMPEFPPFKAPDLGSRLSEVREAILEGRNEAGNQVMFEQAKKAGIDGMIWTNPPVPACQLEFESLDTEPVETYARSTNFETGEIEVAYQQHEKLVHRSAFVSRQDGLAVICFSSPNEAKLNYRFAVNQLPVKEGSDFRPEDFVNINIRAEGHYLHYHSTFRKKWNGSVKGHDVLVKIAAVNGILRVNDRWIEVRDADDIMLLADVKVDKTEPVDGYAELKNKLDSFDMNYDVLLKAHSQIHSEIYNRFQFSLNGREHLQTSEALLASSTFEKTNPALVQQLVKAARYNAMSAAGDLPPTLQGIWGGTWRPMWSGDFTLNGNVPSAIASGLNTNLIELTDAYLNMMLEMKDDFRYNARGMYGLDGIYVPSRAGDHGSVFHFGEHWPHLYWNAGTAWASHFFYDRWLYTGDSDFLKQKAIPFMLDAYTFLSQILYKTEEGKYLFIPSYSPEVGPKGRKESAINATMDVAAMKQLLRNLITLTEQGYIDDAELDEYQDILDHLPEYAIDVNGELKEWIWEGYENENSHRHASHLYPLYDGVDADFEARPELKVAAVKAIESRLEYRRGKNGAEMAFGLVQKGMAAAHLGDIDHAWECVRWLANSYWTPALVSYHDPGEIFNLDISGGLPAVVSYMLVQSTPDEIKLLPCLPEAWPDGSVKGIRARGGFVVDIDWRDGKPVKVAVTSLIGNQTKVTWQDEVWDVQLAKDETDVHLFDRDGFVN